MAMSPIAICFYYRQATARINARFLSSLSINWNSHGNLVAIGCNEAGEARYFLAIFPSF
jgi:hypothetical protein